MKRHIRVLFLSKRLASRGLKKEKNKNKRERCQLVGVERYKNERYMKGKNNRYVRKGKKKWLTRRFLQFLCIPAALWGINWSISPNTRANTPTHLTHAFTELISHSMAHRLTDTLRDDWLTAESHIRCAGNYSMSNCSQSIITEDRLTERSRDISKSLDGAGFVIKESAERSECGMC